jgi:hypothetical protein
MATLETRNEKIERILAILNDDDEIFWRIIAAATQHKDHELLKLAGILDQWSSHIFNLVAELKGA